MRWKGTNNSENFHDEITIADAMFNVLHTCLIVETVGQFAMVLQKDFQPFLFKSLHKILEKSGEFFLSASTLGRLCSRCYG